MSACIDHPVSRMELLGEDAIRSIADLCGVSVNKPGEEGEQEEGHGDQREETELAPSRNCDDTRYIIRRGQEGDVLKDVNKG